MHHGVLVGKVAVKAESRRDGEGSHHTGDDPTLIAKNQEDSAPTSMTIATR